MERRRGRRGERRERRSRRRGAAGGGWREAEHSRTPPPRRHIGATAQHHSDTAQHRTAATQQRSAATPAAMVHRMPGQGTRTPRSGTQRPASGKSSTNPHSRLLAQPTSRKQPPLHGNGRRGIPEKVPRQITRGWTGRGERAHHERSEQDASLSVRQKAGGSGDQPQRTQRNRRITDGSRGSASRALTPRSSEPPLYPRRSSHGAHPITERATNLT